MAEPPDRPARPAKPEVRPVLFFAAVGDSATAFARRDCHVSQWQRDMHVRRMLQSLPH